MQAQKEKQLWGTSLAEKEVKPDVKEFTFDIHQSAELAGEQDMDEEELQEKAQAAGQRGKRVVKICCCGSRGCGIGPFTKSEEV